MPRRHRVLLAGLLLAIAVGAGACGSSSTDNEAASPADAASTPLADEFATIDGESIDLGSLEGQEVVLWFWAPW